MNVAAGIVAALLALAADNHARVLAFARSQGPQAQPRAIVLDVHGPAEEAVALRATLHELTARRGLAFSFDPPGDGRGNRTAEPWATLSVELENGGAKVGPAVTLREGAAGRVRLHRVVPDGASHQVTIEALATIAYTALVTLALEDPRRPAERPANAPRERSLPTPERAPPAAEAETANEPPPIDETSQVALPAPVKTAEVNVPASPATPANAVSEPDTVTVSARAGELGAERGAATFPVRFSLASFAGYQAGNLFGADRRATSASRGMGVTATGAATRWPLAPALGLGLGAWYGTGAAPPAPDGSQRPPVGPRLQGQAEIRLTVLRHGWFSSALGPWLTVSRTTYDFGPAPMAPRGPGQNQGPPGPDALGGPVRASRTQLALGVSARVEAELGGHLAFYCALAGAAPLTRDFPLVPGNGSPGYDPGSPSRAPAVEARWTLSALAGLSVALNGAGDDF